MTCQKLIHGGKLLLDQSTLSEAIPLSLGSPEDENEPTVIHLVAYERSKSAPTPTTSVTGTAGRVHANASSSSQGVRNRQEAGGTNREPPAQEGTDGGERPDIPGQPSQRVVCEMWSPRTVDLATYIVESTIRTVVGQMYGRPLILYARLLPFIGQMYIFCSCYGCAKGYLALVQLS